jgi:hypothetical protein
VREKSRKSSKSELPEITPVSEVENPRSFVVYGLQGTGKTTFASTMPTPLLLLDMNDKGTDSISDVKGVDVARVENADQVDAMYWELAEERTKYKSVVLDTVTALQQMVIEAITGKDDPLDFGSLTKRQFGQVAARMKKIIIDYRDLDMEVMFLAQQRFFNIEEEADDDNDMAEIGPAMMPSIALALNSAVNVIAQTYIRRKVETQKKDNKIRRKERFEYCLRVGPHAIVRTKIRKPRGVVPPSFLIDPTYEDLIDIIEGRE